MNKLASLILFGLMPWAGACAPPSRAALPPQRPAGDISLSQRQLADSSIAMAPVAYHELGRRLLTSGRITFDDQRVAS